MKPCPYCGNPPEFVTGEAIYPHRPDLFYKKFYLCKPCDAFVGCHAAADKDGKGGSGDGTVPLGRLANAELRKYKMAAHTALDFLWQGGKMSRGKAYRLLARKLSLYPDECHIGMFDVDTCKRVIEICKTGLV